MSDLIPATPAELVAHRDACARIIAECAKTKVAAPMPRPGTVLLLKDPRGGWWACATHMGSTITPWGKTIEEAERRLGELVPEVRT